MEREILVEAWGEAVAACDARSLVRAALAGDAGGYDAVIALGKAARGMRDGAIDAVGAGRFATSLVVSGAGAAEGPPHGVWIGEHPVPGPGSVAAGTAALAWARRAASQDRVVLGLVSGGASALCDAPISHCGAPADHGSGAMDWRFWRVRRTPISPTGSSPWRGERAHLGEV